MTATLTSDWINEHVTFGWYLKDSGEVLTNEYVGRVAPLDPIWHDIEGQPVYHPLRQRLREQGEFVALCRICGDPVWAITRHAAQVHGEDIEQPELVKERPDWMPSGWI